MVFIMAKASIKPVKLAAGILIGFEITEFGPQPGLRCTRSGAITNVTEAWTFGWSPDARMSKVDFGSRVDYGVGWG